MNAKRLCLVWAFVTGSFPALAQPDAAFHLPRTEAEKALDAILKRADSDRYQLDNLFDGRGDTHFRRTFDYSAVLTAALIASLRAAEAAMVRRSCSGVYTDEICGLDYSPITCAQDYEYPNVYRTQKVGRNEETVAYAGQFGSKPIAIYRMVKQQSRWKIDGVTCDYLGAKFHAD